MDTAIRAGISGGVATVFTSDMSRAVRFYSETLGLRLVYRAGDHWASIDAGSGFMIGLHPAGEDVAPGVNGSVQIGLNVDRPIEEVVAGLRSRGVSFRGDIVDDGAVKLAFFQDPDGHELYLCEPKHG